MLIPSVSTFETFPPEDFLLAAGWGDPQTPASLRPGDPKSREQQRPRPLTAPSVPHCCLPLSPPALPVKIYSVPHANAPGKICDEETRGIVHKYSQPYANNLKFIFLLFKEEKKSTHSVITSRFIEADIT